MVLTKAAFLHRDYMTAYWKQPADGDGGAAAALADIRAYVDAHRNCEDLAMSMLVANVSKAPPVWVAAQYRDFGQWLIGTGGISSGAGHAGARNECLTHFAKVMGHMPLIATNAKSGDARNSWWWN